MLFSLSTALQHTREIVSRSMLMNLKTLSCSSMTAFSFSPLIFTRLLSAKLLDILAQYAQVMKREYQREELLKENQTIISILSDFCKNRKYNSDFRDYIFTLSIRITPIMKSKAIMRGVLMMRYHLRFLKIGSGFIFTM